MHENMINGESAALARALTLGFKAGVAGGHKHPDATGLPTREQRIAWRDGYMAGAKANAWLNPADEHSQQRALFEWSDLVARALPEPMALMYAVPNGGLRAKAVAGKLKAEGVRAGVPDVCLPWPASGFCGLYIEMKSDKGRLSAEQKQWLERLAAAGHMTATCHGWLEAVAVVLAYLGVATP